MRMLVATACYLASTVVASVLAHPAHPAALAPAPLLLAALAGVVGAYVTGALSGRLHLPTAARVAVLFGLVYALETVSNWVEAVLFISTTSKLIPLTGAVLAAGLTLPVGLLWRPTGTHSTDGAPVTHSTDGAPVTPSTDGAPVTHSTDGVLARALRSRPWWSWVWRVAAAALLWVPVYFLFAAADAPFVTRYYHESGTVFTIPSNGVLATAELTRGLLHALVLGVLAALLSTTRRRAWLWSAVAFSAYNAWLPLIQHVGWPYYLRAANLVEITCDGVAYGGVVVLLLRRRAGTPAKPDERALVDPERDVPHP